MTVRLAGEVRAHTITFKLSCTLGWETMGVVWCAMEQSRRKRWESLDHPGCSGNYTSSHLQTARCARWHNFFLDNKLNKVLNTSLHPVQLRLISIEQLFKLANHIEISLIVTLSNLICLICNENVFMIFPHGLTLKQM